MNSMRKGLEECDLVIIPQEDTQQNRCKGANRMVESIRSGRFVVANEMPAYQQFREWMWLGDIREGLEWVKNHEMEIAERIRAAQEYVRTTFSPKITGEQWKCAFMSDVEIKSLTAI
jgi:hypothetical protein